MPQFTDIASAVGMDDRLDARGFVVADFDNDGDLDFIINHNPGDASRGVDVRPTVLRNDIGHTANWLAVELEGTDSNRDAVGALVRIQTSAGSQLRHRSAGSGYASQHSDRLYFGLGDVETVDRLTVEWPSGARETHTNIASNRLVRVKEGEGLKITTLPGRHTAMVSNPQSE